MMTSLLYISDQVTAFICDSVMTYNKQTLLASSKRVAMTITICFVLRKIVIQFYSEVPRGKDLIRVIGH